MTGLSAPAPVQRTRALPAPVGGFATWWFDGGLDVGFGAPHGPRARLQSNSTLAPASLVASRLFSAGRSATTGSSLQRVLDWRWCVTQTLDPAHRLAACQRLAGVWLARHEPAWLRRWPLTLQRWARALASTQNFQARHDFSAVLADASTGANAAPDGTPAEAAAWAWIELRPRMETGFPDLWARCDGEPLTQDSARLPLLSSPGGPGEAGVVSQGESLRALRAWLACIDSLETRR